MAIKEALMEMYYFTELTKRFNQAYKHLGDLRNVFKPSQPNESWLGYDLAFVLTEMEEDKFEEYIESCIHGRKNKTFFIGLFIQYKVVNLIKQKHTRGGQSNVPSGYNVPFYRSSLKTKPSLSGTYSQHETLVRLSKTPSAKVVYACPMLFSPREVLLKPDLSKLQMVEVNTKVRNYYDKWVKAGTHEDKHHIVFQDKNGANQMWCSDEPMKGESISCTDWIRQTDLKMLSPKEAITLIKDTKTILTKTKSQKPSLYLFEFEQFSKSKNIKNEEGIIVP
ncbi:hypothetical protein [Priestia megaterium]|uniref:hypothetical protein n=1 Tax=Priestia megaterium TaxID=1404 RepID=UPI003458ED42